MNGAAGIRARLALAMGLGLAVVLAGGLAGAGTYALFSDPETDDAGTISITKKNNAAVKWKGCKQADITPNNASNFDMTVTLTDDRSQSYDEDDFSGTTFTYDARNHFSKQGKNQREIATITLDGSTYTSKCA